MSAEHPNLYTERPIFQAARELIRQTESSMDGYLEEPVRLVLKGGTAMALYSPTRSSEDVDAIFSHRILLPEVLVPYVDEHGRRGTLTWGRDYAPVVGLMHPDAEKDAILVAQSPDKRFDIRVLSPVDLAVSMLGRYSDQDQRDIQELTDHGLMAAQDLEARVECALRNCMNYSRQNLKGYDGSFVLHRGETCTAPHLGRFQPGRFVQPKEQDTTNSFLDATGPLHPHRNRCAVTGGAPRHFLVGDLGQVRRNAITALSNRTSSKSR